MQTFTIDDEQFKKLNKWLRKKSEYQLIYSFCPTSIGMVVKVKDEISGDEIDLSEYENW